MTILIIGIVVLILLLWLTRPGRIRGIAQSARLSKHRLKDEFEEARHELTAPREDLEPLAGEREPEVERERRP